MQNFSGKAWTITDSDCMQCRRQLEDNAGKPVFELMKINEMCRTFEVVRAVIPIADYPQSDIDGILEVFSFAPGEKVSEAIIAECIFESEAESMDYDPVEVFQTWDEAAKFIGQETGLDVTPYLICSNTQNSDNPAVLSEEELHRALTAGKYSSWERNGAFAADVTAMLCDTYKLTQKQAELVFTAVCKHGKLNVEVLQDAVALSELFQAFTKAGERS